MGDIENRTDDIDRTARIDSGADVLDRSLRIVGRMDTELYER